MVLRSQVQIDAQLRSYSETEKARLGDLLGLKERWGDTLRPFNWTQGTTMVQGFRGSTEVDIAVPCTYDFDVAAAKYMHGLSDGVIPLSFLFSGTVISRGCHRVLGHPDPVAQGIDLPVPGRHVAAVDGRVLPRNGLAPVAQGHARTARRAAGGGWVRELGRVFGSLIGASL